MDAKALRRASFVWIALATTALPLGACQRDGVEEQPNVHPFTAESYWNTPLPDRTSPDPHNRTYLAWLEEHAPRGILLNGLGNNEWGIPTIITNDQDPLWTVELDRSEPQTERIATHGLRLPDDFADSITGTSDSPAVIVDTSAGFEVHLFQVRKTGERSIHATTAAIYWLDGNGLVYDPSVNPDGDRRNFGHRGVAPSVMVVRDEQIRAGEIPNVLEVFVPGTAECNVRPMVGFEPGRGGVICEGARLRIKPQVDLDAFDLSPSARVIARALQTFGAVVGDNSGVPAVVIKMEQDRGQWSDLDIGSGSLSNVPWSAFEFVDAG